MARPLQEFCEGGEEPLWRQVPYLSSSLAKAQVVVDTFADARDRDILNLAEEMEADVDADRRLCMSLGQPVAKQIYVELDTYAVANGSAIGLPTCGSKRIGPQQAFCRNSCPNALACQVLLLVCSRFLVM